MMTAERRREFERLLVQGVEPIDMHLDVPEFATARWLARVGNDLALTTVPSLSSNGRRLNNFCVGSDPEFVFVLPGANRKTPASELGLRPALAAGCDQNQRLAELRCHPSNSVVEHVAGILTCLRWMYRVIPYVRDYSWRAGAWYDNDGIGGHVHFGRKRPNRDSEVLGLDGIAKALKAAQIFPVKEWERRTQGDAHRQVYGAFGDIRKQLHGYEYRTMPSWLCSPTKAFVVLAVSKLAVLDPELPAKWNQSPLTLEEAHRRLTYLARYYAGRDDDAWILKYLLTRPEGLSGLGCVSDFKPFWGFPKQKPTVSPVSSILPACIEPLKSEIDEIADLLLQAKPLSFIEHRPTFKDSVPTGYVWMYDMGVGNLARTGVGDCSHDLVHHQNSGFVLRFGDRFTIAQNLLDTWTPAEKKAVRALFPKIHPVPDRDHNNLVTIPTHRQGNLLTVDSIKLVRHFLLKMNLFPLWTVNTVKENSFQEWLDYRKRQQTTKKQPRIEERNL